MDRVYALYTLHAKRFEKAIITFYMFNVSIMEKAELVLILPVQEHREDNSCCLYAQFSHRGGVSQCKQHREDSFVVVYIINVPTVEESVPVVILPVSGAQRR